MYFIICQLGMPILKLGKRHEYKKLNLFSFRNSNSSIFVQEACRSLVICLLLHKELQWHVITPDTIQDFQWNGLLDQIITPNHCRKPAIHHLPHTQGLHNTGEMHLVAGVGYYSQGPVISQGNVMGLGGKLCRNRGETNTNNGSCASDSTSIRHCIQKKGTPPKCNS